jgi:hypothetical protein
MKACFIAIGAMVFALGIEFAASAQTATPSGGATAALAEKTSATAPDNTRYLKNPNMLRGCEAQLAAFNDKPCDIIFIGDSITAGWLGAGRGIWQTAYEPRHALDFGIGGDKTQNVLWRLNNMGIQNLKPKVAVVLIGTNNIANTPHEIADGIRAVMANTQEAFPGIRIILVSIMPNARANDTMMQVDSIIRSYAGLLPGPRAADAAGDHHELGRSDHHELEGLERRSPSPGCLRLPNLGRRDGTRAGEGAGGRSLILPHCQGTRDGKEGRRIARLTRQ